MEISKFKSAKRVLCVVLAVAMLITSLFTANIGININADAATVDTTGLKISYWTGGQTAPTKTDTDGTYLITTADELCYVVYNVNGIADYGAKFKIDASVVDIIVLQKEADILAAGGVAELLSCSSAAETKTFFEGMASKTDWFSKYSWKTYNATSFDGSNVPIYGLYSIGGTQGAGNQNVGLFPSTDTGTKGASSSEPATDTTGITYKNIVIKNSYMQSARRLGAIVAATNGPGYGHFVNGVANFEKCVVANNYMICKAGASNYSVTATGIIFGNCDNGDSVKIRNCLVYGNDATHVSYDETTTTKIPLANSAVEGAVVENTISLGASPSSTMGSKATYTAVYTDQSSNYEGVTNIGSVDAAYGAFGKANMPDLDWSSNSTDATWYAIDGALPTLVKPDGWTDVENIEVWDGNKADAFAGGSGTEADPYIIENAGQLYKMVYDGGKTSDGTTENYYKVADGVDSLYLNAAIDCTAVESLVAGGGTYNEWSFDDATTFNGKFDGNGATIYGMVSNQSNVGFIPKLGFNAVIENVTFAGAYVKGGRAAVITTLTVEYTENSDSVFENHYISNVAVIKSYIQSTSSSAASPTAAGFISTSNTPDYVYLTNCIFDGGSSKLIDAGTDATVSAKAGIVSFPNWGNNFIMTNCVAIDAYIVPMVTSVAQNTTDGTWYPRYPLARSSNVEFTNCYSDINPVMYNTVTVSGTDYVYDRITNGVSEINVTTAGLYDRSVIPTLDWVNTWELVEISSGRFIPMPIKDGVEGEYSNYGDMLTAQQSGRGANAGRPYIDGTYGMFNEYTGNGTEADPYIIRDALDLARAIGCGGVNLNENVYYELANDIDLGNLPWLIKTTSGKYTYVPFAGTLDGNGHTITGLNAADKTGTGLIPVLAGGTVKNLHIRDSYAGSATASSAGLIAGVCEAGSVITGCSVEACDVENSDGIITGNWGVASVTYSYVVDAEGTATYCDATANDKKTADQMKTSLDTNVWYVGGASDSAPKLKNRAEAAACVDVAGDDNCAEYDAADLTALRQRLLKKKAYNKICGDVSKDGTVNVIDLAVLRRHIGDTYNEIEDGFWRNVELGNVAIYYGENDNYDAARKMELYIESQLNVDIKKNVSGTNVYVHTNDGTDAPGAKLAIVIGNVGSYTTELTDNNYGISYDEENVVLWIQGANFTGVEQAVLDFIANSNANNGTVYTVASATLSEEKQPKTINGTIYYYAWGDEFNTGESYSQDTWEISAYKSEEKDGSQSGAYWNKNAVNINEISKLWDVNDGKLTIWRGLDASVYNEATHSWGYKSVTLDRGDGYNDFGEAIDSQDVYVDPGCITTNRSMLFKQGYIEMKGTLPSDGHAFPAWWFLTSTSPYNNNHVDVTLYDKVYTLNNNWNGTNAMDPSNLSTYKYQIPTAHLEFDIVELMQAQQGSASIVYAEEVDRWKSQSNVATTQGPLLTGQYYTHFDLTVHKIYTENVKDGNLYIPDWSTGISTLWGTEDNFVTTSSAGTFIHNYNTNKTGYTRTYDFSNASTLTGEHIYGFGWTVDESEGTYTLNVYVDPDTNPNPVMKIDQDLGHVATNDPTYLKGDADIWNQYAYMLLDNSFYTSNAKGSRTGTSSSALYSKTWSTTWNDWDGVAQQFTDLLTQEDGDKATFEIDYVRVYQQDGMRDIVTDETEDFNNGNHFGYGK